MKFYVLFRSINLQNNINKWEFAINFQVSKFHCYTGKKTLEMGEILSISALS